MSVCMSFRRLPGDLDVDRSVGAVDVQLVINAALGLSISDALSDCETA